MYETPENRLEESFAAVILCLEEATDTLWQVEHTGGGCMWICTRFGEPVSGNWWGYPTICVTFGNGPLGPSDKPANAEANEGWMIGGYTNIEEAPEDGVIVQCSTEELPLKVREMFITMGGDPHDN